MGESQEGPTQDDVGGKDALISPTYQQRGIDGGLDHTTPGHRSKGQRDPTEWGKDQDPAPTRILPAHSAAGLSLPQTSLRALREPRLSSTLTKVPCAGLEGRGRAVLYPLHRTQTPVLEGNEAQVPCTSPDPAGPPPTQGQIMTTRGWEVTPPLPSGLRSPPSRRQTGGRPGASSSRRAGSVACLRDLGLSATSPLCPLSGCPSATCSLRDFGETGRPFCVLDGSSVTWSCLPGHLPARVKAKEAGHVPGASARGEEDPWRSSEGITARGACLVPRHCPLTNGEGGRCCHVSFSTMKRKPCKVL